MRKLIASTLCVLGLVSVWCITTWAADLPGTVQPGQIEKQFKKEPTIRAGQPDRVAVPEADQPVPSNAREIRFKLTKIVIEGATVYSESELQSFYKNRLDQEVSLSEIYQIASLLTAKYRNDGYILSRVIVPVQSIEGGEVRLKAIEGYVARVTVDGAASDRRKLVERYAREITKSRPLKNSVLERYLLLMNDLPGAFARATIKPSPSEPGASEMTVHFTQRNVQGGLSADNRGGELMGPLRISADLTVNSALGLQESTTFRLVSSGDNKMNFISIAHEETIGPRGGKLSLSASITKSEPKEMLFIPLNLETSSQTAALTYNYPVIRSRVQNLSLRGSFTAHEGKTEIFGVEDTRDSIRAFRLGVTYDRSDPWRGINLLDIEISQGIDGLGASNKNDPMLSRPNGRIDFTKATLYAARVQSLTERFSVLAAVSGQYAWTDLLSSELYSFGGEQFGRGYDPSEMVGDHGIAGKLELRYTDTLPFRFASSFTLYGFYDVGIVYLRSPDGGKDSESAASAGLGLRMNLGPYVSCFAEIAKPLTRDVSSKQSLDARGYGGISIRF
jgi:hemolysin activation/secretion protein